MSWIAQISEDLVFIVIRDEDANIVALMPRSAERHVPVILAAGDAPVGNLPEKGPFSTRETAK